MCPGRRPGVERSLGIPQPMVELAINVSILLGLKSYIDLRSSCSTLLRSAVTRPHFLCLCWRAITDLCEAAPGDLTECCPPQLRSERASSCSRPPKLFATPQRSVLPQIDLSRISASSTPGSVMFESSSADCPLLREPLRPPHPSPRPLLSTSQLLLVPQQPLLLALRRGTINMLVKMHLP